jgi:predicted nucleic acid-binding protein
MRKNIIFDTGPIISFTLNELLWLLDILKERFDGDFIIPGSVRYELITRPLRTKRFMFEAIRVNDKINEGTLKVVEDKKIAAKGKQLTDWVNNSFKAKDKSLEIVHKAEMESVAAALILDSSALVVDERTTRMAIEEPYELKKLLEKRLHTDVIINEKILKKFKEATKGLKIIRSVELVTVAYNMGLLDKYVIANGKIDKKMKQVLLKSVLWALKLNGCAISKKNIDDIIKLERKI